MLRRYGVMSHPRDAARVLATEGAISAGQLLMDRTGNGLAGASTGLARGRRPRPAPARPRRPARHLRPRGPGPAAARAALLQMAAGERRI